MRAFPKTATRNNKRFFLRSAFTDNRVVIYYPEVEKGRTLFRSGDWGFTWRWNELSRDFLEIQEPEARLILGNVFEIIPAQFPGEF